MQGKKSERRNIKCDGKKNNRETPGFSYWRLALLIFFVGCANITKTKKYPLESLCFSGSGIITVDTGMDKISLRVDTMSKPDSWLIGIQTPLLGEKLIKFSSKHFLDFYRALSGVLKSHISEDVARELYELIFRLYQSSIKKRVDLVSLEHNRMKIELDTLGELNEGKIINYQLKIFYKGFLFDSFVASLKFNYQKCGFKP